MIKECQQVWGEYKDNLKPNRKTGQEIIDFLQSKAVSYGAIRNCQKANQELMR